MSGTGKDAELGFDKSLIQKSSPAALPQLHGGVQEGRIAFLTGKLLEDYHYSHSRFNDSISSQFLDRYLAIPFGVASYPVGAAGSSGVCPMARPRTTNAATASSTAMSGRTSPARIVRDLRASRARLAKVRAECRGLGQGGVRPAGE